jgi:hypothetical protein
MKAIEKDRILRNILPNFGAEREKFTQAGRGRRQGSASGPRRIAETVSSVADATKTVRDAGSKPDSGKMEQTVRRLRVLHGSA